MKTGDKILIAALLLLSIALIIPFFFHQESGQYAVVKVRNEEKLRVPLNQDGEYSVSGTLGEVHITVQGGKAAVTQENSPHHYCSRQGYVDSPDLPIVCLPNETVVTIEGGSSNEDTVIQ